MWWKKKKKVEDKQSRNLRCAMRIVGLVAVVMLISYFGNYHYGFSENQADWGAFGAYMGAITGLLAFLGVLYTIRQSSIQAVTRDERDLFFRLMDEHRKTRDTLIYPTENKKGIEAIGAYVDDINKDFQLLIILSSSFGYKKFREWSSAINFKEQDEDTSKYRSMYEDLIIDVLECISVLPVLANPKKKVDLTKLHDENPEVKHATCEQCFSNLEELITIIEEGTLDTERFDYSKIPNASNLAFVARMIWRHLDNYGRCRALIYTGKIFHKKHLVPITYYFNNLAYTTYTLDNFVRTNKDYYMKYWRSKFSADEIYLLLFYLASDKLDVDILQTVIDYRLFDNLGTRDLVDLKQQDFRGTALAHELIKAIIEEKKEEKRRNEEK